MIVLNDGSKFQGFKIIENLKDAVFGWTEQQRQASIKDLPFFIGTYINKNYIETIRCPYLEAKPKEDTEE